MSTERSFDSVRPMVRAVADVLPGIRRVTLEALGVGHVHCYLLRGPRGWTLVDTGLGGAGAGAAWREVVGGLDGPLEQVVITHMHVDHVGAAADVAPLSAGPVLEGRLDRAQADAAYRDARWPGLLREHFVANGLPEREAAGAERSWRAFAGLVRAAPTEPLEPGDRVDGWEVLLLPGHADGHLGLLRDGVLVGGDVLLPDVTPTIGVWPGCDPDPLGLYLETLGRIEALAPRVVLPGHGEPVADPPARARATAAHHRDRLDAAAAALRPEPRTAYEVSLDIWPASLEPGQRSFAVAEALAHLERLAREGRAEPAARDGRTAFSSPISRT